MKVLVTGGAGFVGSHLVDALVKQNHKVRIYDCLVPQVHGRTQLNGSVKSGHINPRAEFIHGDMQDIGALRDALQDIEIIFHQAAEVGVGQSMYEITRYVDANTGGTAHLLQLLVNESHTVQKLIVASSMSIYGEGAYECEHHGKVAPQLRPDTQLAERNWDVRCPVIIDLAREDEPHSHCNMPLRPIPTTENKALLPTSIYAITKMDQELMSLAIGRAYGLPTVALRYFNIYGPRQALSNPYTGVAAIFSSRLLSDKAPIVFEDGRQTRDFIHVSDIVRANLLAMERDEANYGVFNVGTGRPTTVLNLAHALADSLGVDRQPDIVQQFRAGDIRHCLADTTRSETILGFKPQVRFEAGMQDLIAWVRDQTDIAALDHAQSELQSRGLTR